MSSEFEEDKISAAFRDRDKITQALASGVRKALLEHKKLGNSVAVWRDGKVVWIPPEEIPVDESTPGV